MQYGIIIDVQGLRKHDKYLLIEITLLSDQHAPAQAYLVRHKQRLLGIRNATSPESTSKIALRTIKKIIFHHTTNMTETYL
jgi:hypothetical protein